MGKLTNKVAVVTGASKGIGAGIAKGLAAEGAAVVVNYASSKEGAERVVAEITRQGRQGDRGAGRRGQGGRCEAALRRNQEGLWPGGCAGEQRRRLSIRSPGADHRRGISSPIQYQRAGPVAGHPGGRKVFRWQRRKHHQHRFRRQHADAATSSGLCRHQGRGGRGHAFAGQGTWSRGRSG